MRPKQSSTLKQLASKTHLSVAGVFYLKLHFAWFAWQMFPMQKRYQVVERDHQYLLSPLEAESRLERSFLCSLSSRNLVCKHQNRFVNQTNKQYKQGQVQDCTAAPNKTKKAVLATATMLGSSPKVFQVPITVSLGWKTTNLAKWQARSGITGCCLSGLLLPFF